MLIPRIYQKTLKRIYASRQQITKMNMKTIRKFSKDEEQMAENMLHFVFLMSNMFYHQRNANYYFEIFYLTPVRMAMGKTKMLVWLWRKGTTYCLEECKLVQPLWKSAWRHLQKLKNQSTMGLAVTLLGIQPKDCILLRDSCSSLFIFALFLIARNRGKPRCPSAMTR